MEQSKDSLRKGENDDEEKNFGHSLDLIFYLPFDGLQPDRNILWHDEK